MMACLGASDARGGGVNGAGMSPVRSGAHRNLRGSGSSPPCETYLTSWQVDQPETFYPLHVRICSDCLLVQLPAYVDNEEIFSDYAYFSSYSDSWVGHAGGLSMRWRTNSA